MRSDFAQWDEEGEIIDRSLTKVYERKGKGDIQEKERDKKKC